MISSTRKHLLALALTGAVLGVPAAASADTFCVGTADCPAGATSFGTDLQAALDAAENFLSTDDVIFVGAGGSPYVGKFTYDPSPTSGPVVERDPQIVIKAVGSVRPQIVGLAKETVLDVDRARVEGLEIVSHPEGEAAVSITDGSLVSVEVRSQNPKAVGGFGVEAHRSVRLVDSWLTNSGTAGLHVNDGAAVQAANLHTANANFGVLIDREGSAALIGSRIDARNIGVVSDGKTSLTTTSVTTSEPDATGIQQVDGRLLLDHVTVAHVGPSSTATAVALAASEPTDVGIRASALGGYSVGMRREVIGQGRITLTVDDSVWSRSRDQGAGDENGPSQFTRSLDAEPRFVNLAARDLRPLAGSPQIDRESRSLTDEYRDRAGQPANDGDGDGVVRADAGALELGSADVPVRVFPRPDTATAPSGAQAPTGVAPAPRAAGTVRVRDRRAPRLSRLKITKGRRLSFRVDEAATVRIKLGRKTLVRKVKAGTRSIALKGLVGKRRGRIRISVSAADAAGNRSAARIVRRTLRKR